MREQPMLGLGEAKEKRNCLGSVCSHFSPNKAVPLSTATKKQTASGWQDRDVGVKRTECLLGSYSPGCLKESEMHKRRLPRLGRQQGFS